MEAIVLYFNADARTGMSAASACNTCCCETIKMRPGETNLLTINYAQWSVPMGWLMAGTEVDIKHDTSACSTAAIDGFVAPTNTNYVQATAVGATTAINLAASATPAGNTFTYELIPFSGPENGTVAIAGGVATYTPAAGFIGHDNFWYKMTDAQGRVVVRSVTVTVGAPITAVPRVFSALLPFIDLSKVKINEQMHTICFPVTMPYSCLPCDVYRVTVRQPARDCDGNTFHHFKCFDFRCGGC